jgi:predicted transcriptional regulator
MNKIKEQAIEFIKAAPDNDISSLEDVLKEIYFKMQVDKGMAEIKQGLGVPHEEAKAKLSQWLKD